MAQYRFGTFVSSGSAETLDLGFVPSSFKLTNYTEYATNTKVSQALYFSGMTAAYALIQTVNGTAIPVQSIQTTNGFTVFSTGGSWTATQATISGATKANPCVITANSHGFATGDTVTISGVVGMIQLNQNRYIITKINANSFSLNDLFGNPVDSSAYTTYVSGGIANKISDDSTPPGLQEDNGAAGIIIGSAICGDASDVIYWEAWLDTPTGY